MAAMEPIAITVEVRLDDKVEKRIREIVREEIEAWSREAFRQIRQRGVDAGDV